MMPRVTARYTIRIELAVLLSVLFHLAAYTAWQYRHVLISFPLLMPLKMFLALYERPRPPAAHPATTITFIEAIQPDKQKKPEKPKTFIETDNSQVTGEKPKDADLYSDRDTVATNDSNPSKRDSDTPFIDGKNNRIASTVDVLLPTPPSPPMSLPPIEPPTPIQAEPVEPAKSVPPQPVIPPPVEVAPPPPTPPANVGLKLYDEAKLIDPVPSVPPAKPHPLMPTPAHPPSSSQPADSSGRTIVTPKTKLTTAGVSRTGVTAFNVASSPFGEYDKKVVAAVQSRWYALINRYGIYERAGVVTIHFKLHDDGTVHGLLVRDNSAGEILALYCQKAILDSSPFDPFPDNLRVLVGQEPREVDFTFYY
jgi:hypothetical protein